MGILLFPRINWKYLIEGYLGIKNTKTTLDNVKNNSIMTRNVTGLKRRKSVLYFAYSQLVFWLYGFTFLHVSVKHFCSISIFLVRLGSISVKNVLIFFVITSVSVANLSSIMTFWGESLITSQVFFMLLLCLVIKF